MGTSFMIQSIVKIRLSTSLLSMINMAGARLMMLVLGCAVLINATSPTGCKFGGKEYAQGEVFVTGSGLNCARWQCGGGYGAGVGCLPLCGLSMVNCGGPYEGAYKKRHVASAPGCYCMDPYCKKIVGPPGSEDGPPAPAPPAGAPGTY